jgi:hypothetical protein
MARSIKRCASAIVFGAILTCLPAGALAQVSQLKTAPPDRLLSPNPGTDNYLLGVKAISPSNAWSVGYYCTTQCGSPEVDRSMILHWNGTAWSKVPNPNLGTSDRLETVSAVSATNVWAAGRYSSSVACGPLIEHWNGTAWSTVTNPFATSCDDISGLYAESANDIWAVGNGPSANGVGTLILHWNGAAWSQVASPNPSKTYDVLTGVSASSASNAWAVGYYCKSNCSSGPFVFGALVLHWNGSSWSKVATPATTSSQLLNGVNAISATNAWAFGYQGATDASLVMHWNGTAWSKFSSPNAGPLDQAAFGSSTSGWAFGGFPALRWNGTKWATFTLPYPGIGPVAASADGTNDVWTVGSFCSGSGCTSNPQIFRTVTMHWNGTSWSVK